MTGVIDPEGEELKGSEPLSPQLLWDQLVTAGSIFLS